MAGSELSLYCLPPKPCCLVAVAFRTRVTPWLHVLALWTRLPGGTWPSVVEQGSSGAQGCKSGCYAQ